MDNFQTQSNDFLDWFKSQAGSTFDSRLQITDLRSQGAGRGIVATSEIPAETELFSIPRTSIISVENSVLSKKLPKIFTTLNGTEDDEGSKEDVEMMDDGEEDGEEDIKMPDPWLDLIMVMIYEFLQGENSIWKRYFQVLPESFDTLMFWHETELQELQASAVKDKIGKESADDMFKTKVLPVIKQHQDIFYGGVENRLSDEEIIQLAHRMGSIIMAYAFDLEKEDEDEDEEEGEEGWIQDRDGTVAMGMIPMADMLNADAEFNAHLNHTEEKLTMTSLRPIKAGEEILNYYGPLPNCDLLRRYGYTSQKHSRYDVVEISWALISQSITSKLEGDKIKAPAQVAEDEDMEESFVLERESGEPDDTGILTHTNPTFSSFSEDLEEQIYTIISPALSLDTFTSLNKSQRKQLKIAFFDIMKIALEQRQAQYPTTLVQDEQLVKKGNIQGRVKMAVDVRLGEKKLLREAMAFVQASLEKLKPAVEELEGPRAKRQKR